jgi:Na+/H+ antiporter NhaD/arsenite permease-like protein
VLLLTRRIRPEKVMNEIDWNLLVFFAALFIVSGAMETSGITASLFEAVAQSLNGSPVMLSVVTVGLSNLVSNVPAVLLLKPVIPTLSNPQAGWLTLAATSTLAGNLTLLGSVANLIVAEVASRRGIKLTFWEYTKPGFVITVISLVLGVMWIQLFIWK